MVVGLWWVGRQVNGSLGILLPPMTSSCTKLGKIGKDLHGEKGIHEALHHIVPVSEAEHNALLSFKHLNLLSTTPKLCGLGSCSRC